MWHHLISIAAPDWNWIWNCIVTDCDISKHPILVHWINNISSWRNLQFTPLADICFMWITHTAKISYKLHIILLLHFCTGRRLQILVVITYFKSKFDGDLFIVSMKRRIWLQGGKPLSLTVNTDSHCTVAQCKHKSNEQQTIKDSKIGVK